jgi:hypothetical protein
MRYISLPILQTISQVEIETVVKTPISKKLLQGQERMIGDNFFPIRARTLIDGELGASFVVQAILIFGSVETI